VKAKEGLGSWFGSISACPDQADGCGLSISHNDSYIDCVQTKAWHTCSAIHGRFTGRPAMQSTHLCVMLLVFMVIITTSASIDDQRLRTMKAWSMLRHILIR